MAINFVNKVAIVTGASSGIGEAIAVRLGTLGASVTLCGRDRHRLQEVTDRCIQSTGRKTGFFAVSGDLKDAATRKRIMDQTMSRHGHLDILVSNAGVGKRGDNLEKLTEEAFDSIVGTNVKAGLFLIQQALPLLESSQGNIVFVSSILSQLPSTIALAYSISTAGLDQLSRCLALSLGSKGIRVNSVNPATVATRFSRDIPGVPSNPEEVAEILNQMDGSNHPLYGRLGSAEEVADCVAFLASDCARFVTGQCLKVDGGRSFKSWY